MYRHSDPFLMLVEEHLRDLHEDAQREARVQAITTRRRAPRARRGVGILRWIGRAFRSPRAHLRAAGSPRGASTESDRDARDPRGRRPAA